MKSYLINLLTLPVHWEAVELWKNWPPNIQYTFLLNWSTLQINLIGKDNQLQSRSLLFRYWASWELGWSWEQFIWQGTKAKIIANLKGYHTLLWDSPSYQFHYTRICLVKRYQCPKTGTLLHHSRQWGTDCVVFLISGGSCSLLFIFTTLFQSLCNLLGFLKIFVGGYVNNTDRESM